MKSAIYHCNKFQRSIAVLFILVCVGCASTARFERYAQGWVGEPIDRLMKVVSRPEGYASRSGIDVVIYEFDNGNKVYVIPESPNCIVHWMVDQKNIIIDYTYRGTGCSIPPDLL